MGCHTFRHRRQRMRYRSKKQEALYRERRPLVARLLEERPACEACPAYACFDGLKTYRQNRSQDIHELVNRSQGGSILDEKNLLAVCRPCHTRITQNPLEAEGLGLHLPSWTQEWMYSEAHHVRLSWSRGDPVTPEWIDDETL